MGTLVRNRLKPICLGKMTHVTTFFANYARDINASIRSSNFRTSYNMQKLYRCIKRSQTYLRKIIGLSAFSQTFVRFIKDVYAIK